VPDRLELLLDASQRREDPDRSYMAAVVQGNYGELFGRPLTGWDPRWGTKDGNSDHLTWVDPVTGTLMLTPAPLLRAWETTSTGIYARLGLSDVTLGDATKWKEHVMDGSASKFLKLTDSNAGAGARTILTNTTWPKNRPFYLGWFVWDWNAAGRGYRLEGGWNNSANSNSGVSFRIFADGEVEIYKDAVHVGGGRIPVDKQNSVLRILLIPFRQRDLLVYSPAGGGGGFVHTFTDIDEQATDPTITGATKFWAYVPEGSADLELAPIRFSSSAYRASVPIKWRRAPEAGDVLRFTRPGESLLPFAFFPGYGTQSVVAAHRQSADPTQAFNQNGVNVDARFVATLSGDGESTAFLHAIEGFWENHVVDTPGASEDLVRHALSCRLEVPESPQGARMTVEMAGPESVDPDLARGLLTTSNRPLIAKVRDREFFNGYTEPVRWQESVADSARKITLEVRDVWKRLEQFRFADPVPLDRMALHTAFETILDCAGLAHLYDSSSIPDIDFSIPFGGPNAQAGWSAEIQVGDSAAEWLSRLHESYCANFEMRVRPTPTGTRFVLKDLAAMGSTPLLSIYDRVEDALADATVGSDRRKARWLTFRGYEEWMQEPEATDVFVTGLDRRSLRPLQAIKRDMARRDPALPPENRPDGWLGEPRRYGWVDGTLTTQDAVNRCCDLLFTRLHVPRFFCEWEGELLIDPVTNLPLWPGDVLRLVRTGSGKPDVDARIVSFSTEFEMEPWEDPGPATVRSAKYVAEHLLPEEPDSAQALGYGSPGLSLAELKQWSLYSMVSKTQGPDVNEDWALRLPIGGPVIR
jgi:hypothetical protein